MVQDRLLVELDKVASRFRRLWESQTYSATLLICSALTLLAASSGVSFIRGPNAANAAIISLAVLLVASILLRSRFLIPDRNWIARQVEARYPELDSCLLAAVEQNPALADGRYGFLQLSVISQALEHAALRDWSQVVSRRRMGLAVASNLATFALLMCAVMFAARPTQQTVAGTNKNGPRSAATAGTFSVAIEPGNTEIEKGSSLLVLARVQGPLPADATLVYQSQGSEAIRLPMSASLDDPIFGGRVSAVTQPFEYHVELGGQVTPAYHVTVFEYPRLERADARLAYPSYTGLEERLIQDVRTVSVVEGTSVTLICQLNKPVKSARLVDSSPVAPQAAVGPNNKPAPVPAELVLAQREGSLYEAKFTAEMTRRFKLELLDEAGRKNTEQALIVVQVVPNQPPTLKLVAPARDLEVSPLEELDVKATAWDDYGVKRMGVSFGLAGAPPTDVVLGENAAARQKHELANSIRFEDLNAEPDQLLAYHFWAEDFGPDGTLRRTSSDMFFAEVRHFDEIFRQGQQPPGGQQQRQQQQNSQAGQQAQQLAQLQKDIINATWKLLRREIHSQPTASFVEDVKQISESQSSALEQADALSENVEDAESQVHLLAVLEAMQQAVKHLQAAQNQSTATPLQPALVAEQSAYQALLKLRAREHDVVRQQQQASSSSRSQSGRSQQQRQQMQQLDLTNEENRYETQRLAQTQQETPEDRETRQVLNRLKELARRQHDLNERLKDLQSALQEAQNEQKKEEIRQQLKRLQDEQRDVLRDTDELQTRMETPENQERMAEERQQLEQARDQVQRTSEALDKDEVTQAAAAGTRAEREFEELRNEFRRQSSSRFNEEMREMRDAARELDQKEKELAEKLTQSVQPDQTKKSLRDDNPTEQIAQGLNDQKSRLSNLTQRLQETVQEAEQTEPLLSERLNDAARNLQDQKVEQALDAAGRSLQRGLLDDAREVERIANKGIGQLKEGIEKAAEAVLGDETEALRRAREQLKNLAQELNQEIARNAPEEGAKLPADRERADANGSRNPGEASKQSENSEQNPDRQREPGAGQPNGEEGQQSERKSAGRPSNQPGIGTSKKAKNDGGEQEQGEQNGERPPGQSQAGERQPGQQQGRNQQPEQRQPGQRGQGQPQAGETLPGGQQPGETPNQERPAGESQPGAQPMPQGEGQGQPQQGQQGQQSQQGQRGQNPQDGQQPGQRGGQRGGAQRLGGPNPQGPQEGGRFDERGGGNREFAPISGQDFLEWSDRLRDVEEMVDDPELRAEAARIRDQARSIRAEMKRHSLTPNWKLVRVSVAEPLAELANRVADELVRRNSKEAIVPLDRDPVPPKYSEKTRRYYERLGSGQ